MLKNPQFLLLVTALIIFIPTSAMTQDTEVPTPTDYNTQVSVLFFAQDKESRSIAVELEYFAQKELNALPHLTLVNTNQMLNADDYTSKVRQLEMAHNHFLAGKKYYQKLELKQAKSKFTAASELFEKNFGDLEHHDEYILNAIFLGASNLLLKNQKQTSLAFQKILLLDPDYNIQRDYFSPSVNKALLEEAKTIKTTPRGAVQIKSTPNFAKVFIDGSFRGTTPCTVNRLLPGDHLVVIQKEGLPPWTQKITVNKTDTEILSIKLEISSRSKSYLRALKGIKDDQEITKDQAGPNIKELRSLLLVDQIILGQVTWQEEKDYEISLQLYDLRTSQKISSHSDEVEWDDNKQQIAKDLLSGLYSGRISFIEKQVEDQTDRREPAIVSKWWFWTGIGAVAVAGVIFGIVLSKDNESGLNKESGRGAIIVRF